MSNSPPFNHAPLTLRDYQIDIVDQLDELDHPLVPLPTGAGKTVELAQVTRGRSAHARNFTLEEKRRLPRLKTFIAVASGDEDERPSGGGSNLRLRLRAGGDRGRQAARPPCGAVRFASAPRRRQSTQLPATGACRSRSTRSRRLARR